ncbi:MAG: sensor histidine kinase [Alcaligenaceae bacterium]|nr:sensor histidine kinase [Alcaligenaceae bacterium SAGV5]MPS55218.1 sensor histidine kinase [Alcaligenaceae bacterium SAGV3]MPT59511.1 sensor histidine kinase [Alcaligenaceae bacterium]
MKEDSLWQRLNPRHSLSAAIGSVVFVVVVIAAVLGAVFSASRAEQQAQDDHERLLRQFAMQIMANLQSALATRVSVIKAAAAQIAASSDTGAGSLGRHLAAIYREFPEFSSLSVVDGRGRFATGGSSSSRSGTAFSFEPDVSAPAADLRPDTIEIAVPLHRDGGHAPDAIVGALSWSWLGTVLHELEQGLNTERHVQVSLSDKSGHVLIGPGQPGAGPRPSSAEAERMLAGAYSANVLAGEAFDWTITVRQDARIALAAARRTRDIVFVATFLSGLLAALLAAYATHVLLRPLRRLAGQAQAVQQGRRGELDAVHGVDEVAHIGNTLAATLQSLSAEKQALLQLNTELDRRVADRTARIERMAEEARQAAIGRERLRMARDLHDTLAQSLMAVLTQLRMIRKLGARMSPGELDTELLSAENVAGSGLVEARAAIKQMRHNGVRELGLGAALAELADRFERRTGIPTVLARDEQAAALAGERAEVAFRIAEEALRNIERHARAGRVSIGLSMTAAADPASPALSAVHLEVMDDGVGFDPAAPVPGHYGLRGIAEQAALMQARLEIRSSPGQGTRILLELDP